MNKLVSVIIPCYNQGIYLIEAIESVLLQTYPFFEIVVVNDGSTENIAEIVKHYSQIKFIAQKNQGVSKARNNGLIHSSGEYLVFLDSDDKLLPNALEIGVRFMEHHAECAFVSGCVRLITSNGQLIETPPQPKVQKNHYEHLLQSNYIWTPGVAMYRKSVFDGGIGFSTEAERWTRGLSCNAQRATQRSATRKIYV